MHFSLTIDTWSAMLFVHWNEESPDGRAEYYMERIMHIILHDEHGVADMRAVMKRIIVHAMGPRLQKLREAADKRGLNISFPDVQGNKRRRPSSIGSSPTISWKQARLGTTNRETWRG
jgi:hypothetical protein